MHQTLVSEEVASLSPSEDDRCLFGFKFCLASFLIIYPIFLPKFLKDVNKSTLSRLPVICIGRWWLQMLAGGV